MKDANLSKAKKLAWQAFSLYIRLLYADCFGIVKCVTCPTVMHFKEAQAGHYIDGRTNSVLYEEMLVHPQCMRCNIFLHGNKVQYTVFMIEKYGLSIEGIKKLAEMKNTVKSMKAFEHLEIRDKYKELSKNLPNWSLV